MAQDWEINLVRNERFKGLPPDRQKVLYDEARKRFSSTQEQAPQSTLGSRISSLEQELPQRNQDVQRLFGSADEASRYGTEHPIKGTVGPILALVKHAVTLPQQLASSIGLDVMKAATEQRPIGIKRPLANLADVVRGRRGVMPSDLLEAISPDSAVSSGPVKFAIDVVTAPGGVKATKALYKGGVDLGKIGLSATKQKLGQVGDLLSGSKRALKSASDEIVRTSDKLSLQLMQGGENNPTFWSNLKALRDRAWRPAQKAIESITETVTPDDVDDVVRQMHPNDPERANQVIGVIRDTFNDIRPDIKPVKLFDQFGKEIATPDKISSYQIADISKRLGGRLSKAVISGKKAGRASDQLVQDSRQALVELIDQKVPADQQGQFRLGKQLYKQYAERRDRIFKLAEPGLTSESSPKDMANLLTKFAEGKATPDDLRLLRRTGKMFGVDLEEFMKPSATGLQKAQRTAEKADRYKKIGIVAGAGGGAYAAGSALANLFSGQGNDR